MRKNEIDELINTYENYGVLELIARLYEIQKQNNGRIVGFVVVAILICVVIGIGFVFLKFKSKKEHKNQVKCPYCNNDIENYDGESDEIICDCCHCIIKIKK